MGDHDYRYDAAINVLSVDVNLHDGSWAQRAEIVTWLRNNGFTVAGEGLKMRSFVISAAPAVFTRAGGDFAAHAAALARDQQSARDREARLADPDASRAALEGYLDARARVHLRRVAPVGTPWDAAAAAVAAPGGTDPEALRRMAELGQPSGEFPFDDDLDDPHWVAIDAWTERAKATDGAQWQTDLPTLARNPGQYLYLNYEPAWLPSLTRLARTQARPDERVLAATREWRFEGRRHREVDLLVLTHGFAIRDRQSSYRVDALVSFVPVDRADPHRELFADVNLGGDFSITAEQDSIMFDVLWLQRRLQEDAANGAVSAASGSGDRPAARLIRTAHDAEVVAGEWMTYWGFTHVAVTPVGADGGVDVLSDEAVAQVKAETVPTGRPKLQQHHGVATAHAKTPLFFSLAGYTQQALDYAQESQMALFTFDLQGEPEPANAAAHALTA